MQDELIFINCTCSEQQQEWQDKAVKALLPMAVKLRDAVSAFNTRPGHQMSLNEEITVAIISDWLKYLNSFHLLVRYGKFDVAIGVVRTLLELSIQLGYLLKDNKELKAAYYYVSFFIKGHRHNVLLFSQGSYSLEQQRLNATIIPKVKANTDVNVQRVCSRVLANDQYTEQDAKLDWYKLHYEHELKQNRTDRLTFVAMFDAVADEFDPERLLLKKDILYGCLSQHAHGLVSAMNSVIENGVQHFRNFEDPQYATWLLNIVVMLTQLNFLALRKGYPNFDWINDEELAGFTKDI